MMKKLKIIDNFLDKDSFLEIKKFIMSPRCQWRFVDFIAHKDKKNEDNDGYFVHSFTDCDPISLRERFQRSPNFSIISSLMEKINQEISYKDVLRVRSSLYPRRQYQKPDAMHTDYKFSHNVCIFYVNTTNGYTLFEKGEKVFSVENRLLIFNGLERHCSVVQSDSAARFIININTI